MADDTHVLSPEDVADMQAEGALPAGTPIVKQNMMLGDYHADGAAGVVRGSVRDRGVVAYFIEWADMPGIVVGTMGYKVRRANHDRRLEQAD